MIRCSSPAVRSSTAFTWKIVCRSGTLSYGCSTAFLLTLVIAKQEKGRWVSTLPLSTLRVQLLYPNGQRVSKQDIRAALNALSDERVMLLIRSRASTAFAGADLGAARGSACEGVGGGFADFAKSNFCQAGVVAPPDSPDSGNPVEWCV